MSPRQSRIIASVVLALLLAIGGGWWVAGTALSAPVNRPVGPPPADLHAQPVSFDGVQGWLLAAPAGSPCIVVMHGLYSTRIQMEDRARLLHEHGYSVLIFDFQAHGETPGDKITFGYYEAANAASAVNWMRQNVSCRRLVALGISMGGAAALLGPRQLPVDALVLESVYPTFEDAVRNRVVARTGTLLGPWLASLLYEQMPLRLHIPLAAMHPIDRIGELHCPVLIMSGGLDRFTTPAETMRLFAAAPSPKSYWFVQGAAHQDLYAIGGNPYAKHLLAFLDATDHH